MYLTFAWRYFKAKKSANAINLIAWVTTGVIAFATCCQILVMSVFNGFEDLVKSLYSSFYSDIKVIPAKGKTFLLDPGTIAEINGIPGVTGVSMIAEEKALLKADQGQVVVTLKGVDNRYARISGVPEKVVQGNFETGDLEHPMLVVGAGIRYAAGISMDPAFGPQSITVILPKNPAKAVGEADMLSISEAAASGMFVIQQEFDDNFVFTNLDFIRNRMNFGENEFSAAEIRLERDADPDDTRIRLKKLLGERFLIQTKYEQNTSLFNTMRLEKWVIFAVLTLILIIAAFNMISALTMLVLEKKQDIQILKSLGAGNTAIKRIFLSEGILLGMIGTGTGVMLGFIICLLQQKFKLIKLTGGAFLIDYFPVKIVFWDFLLVAVTAWVITWLASVIPSGKAAGEKISLR